MALQGASATIVEMYIADTLGILVLKWEIARIVRECRYTLKVGVAGRASWQPRLRLIRLSLELSSKSVSLEDPQSPDSYWQD